MESVAEADSDAAAVEADADSGAVTVTATAAAVGLARNAGFGYDGGSLFAVSSPFAAQLSSLAPVAFGNGRVFPQPDWHDTQREALRLR